MIIYFINGESTLKGPYDITDPHHKRIMRVGDVCIRETNDSCSFLLIVSATNKWTACKCIDSTSKTLGIDENTLLFSFDGISKRHGNLAILENLSSLFEKSLLHKFFSNAINILSYKSDLWDMSIFKDIYLLPSSIKKHKITHLQQDTEFTTITLFQKYLSPNTNSLLVNLHSQGKSLRETYQIIKNTFPDDFRQAMKSFLKDYPKYTIYDKP